MVLLKWCHIVAWLTLIYVSLGSSVSSMELTKVSKQYRDFIIPITDGNLDLVAGVRDYFTLIIITSSNPQHGCKTCEPLNEVVFREGIVKVVNKRAKIWKIHFLALYH